MIFFVARYINTAPYSNTNIHWFSRDTTFICVKRSNTYASEIIIIIIKVVFIKIITKMKFSTAINIPQLVTDK